MSPKGQKRVFGHISETKNLRESGLVSKCRGNYKQLSYLTFWSVTYSFQDRAGQSSDPLIENEKNRIYTWDMRPVRLCNPSDCSCFNLKNVSPYKMSMAISCV